MARHEYDGIEYHAERMFGEDANAGAGICPNCDAGDPTSIITECECNEEDN